LRRRRLGGFLLKPLRGSSDAALTSRPYGDRMRRFVGALLIVVVCSAPAEAAAAPRVFTLAGFGASQLSGDGGLATDAGGEFRDVVALRGGGFLVSGQVVRRVDARGVITTVAGNGSFSYQEPLGDGGPATSANLNPQGLAVLPNGGFLVADPGHHRVRLVNAQGVISTVAGSGSTGFVELPPGPRNPLGDGGPATSAGLLTPVSVSVLRGGGFLIADWQDDRVRMVNAHGIITTVAGTGTARTSGDGGPATRAGLHGPSAVAALPHGGFLIAEQYGRRVRRVDAHGVITTVAGTGHGERLGDGGPATRAALWEPMGLAVLPGGGFLIADAGTGRVRRVDANGIITTLAGAPAYVRSGRLLFPVAPARAPWSGLSDGLGGLATGARLTPLALAVEHDGSVLVGAASHVLMLARGRHPPLAVAIRPPSIRAGSVRLNVAASEPGRERIVVRAARDGRRVAALTRAVRAGVADFRLPRLPGGALVVRASLSGQGRRASDETAIFSGRVLPARLARAAIARRCCHGGPPVIPVTRARQAQEGEFEETRPSVISCRRFAPRRVDCQSGRQGHCEEATSAVLRDTLIYLTETNSCAYSKYPRHHGAPWIAPLL
jgi:NHL repeat